MSSCILIPVIFLSIFGPLIAGICKYRPLFLSFCAFPVFSKKGLGGPKKEEAALRESGGEYAVKTLKEPSPKQLRELAHLAERGARHRVAALHQRHERVAHEAQQARVAVRTSGMAACRHLRARPRRAAYPLRCQQKRRFGTEPYG